MNKQILFTTSDDRTRLRLVRWGEAERDILVLHGLAEHAGRYEHVAKALVDAGWRVTFLELRGHGESQGQRGHVSRWHAYVEDVQAAAATIGRPFVLLAHSMGGAVALSTLQEPITPKCRAVAISNPLLHVRFQPAAWKTKLSGLFSRVLPRLPIPNEVDPKQLTHDTEIVRAYETDPLVFGTVTPRWFRELRIAQASIREGAASIRLPLRMMVSEGDQICDPEHARHVAKTWGGPSELVEYGDMYHELFNESERDRVLSELVDWLESLD